MEDARKGRLLEKKKEVLLAFFKTFYESYKEEHGGTRPAFNFADLQEVASVKAILEDINVQTFPEMLLPELEAELRITLEGRAENLKSECIADVHRQREGLGLLAFDSMRSQGEGSAVLSPIEGPNDLTTDCPLLAASTVFTICLTTTFNGPYRQRDITFRRAMELYLGFPYPENVRYRIQPLPWKRPEFQRNFAEDAEEILKGLGLPLNVTFAHMHGIAKTFQCRQCRLRFPHASWVAWVRYSVFGPSGTYSNMFG